MRKFTKKRVIVAFSLLSLLFGAAAIAYLSTAGSGTGTGTVSSAGSANAALSGSLDKSLSHIGDTATLTITGKNTGDSPAHIGDIQVDSIVLPTDCPAGSFVVGTISQTSHDVAADSTAHTLGTATVTFQNDTSADQSKCAGSLTFNLSAPSA